MDSYRILREVLHIGSRVSGVVIDRDELTMLHGVPGGNLALATDTGFPVRLPFMHLVDELSAFSPDLIPPIGSRIDTVVFNFVDGSLYLSAKPSDLLESTIRKWQQYYDFIEALTVGDIIIGRVERVWPFGLFVDMGAPFIGLIDIGHTQINRGRQLPCDTNSWPVVGEAIRCTIAYFRMHDQQVGLGWLPEISE